MEVYLTIMDGDIILHSKILKVVKDHSYKYKGTRYAFDRKYESAETDS
jgi:hypothetical protein